MDARDNTGRPLKSIGIISARDAAYHPNRRLLEAAAQRGSHAVLIDPYQVRPVIRAGRTVFLGRPDPARLNVILPRQGATVGDSSLALIQGLAHMGIPLVNGPAAIRIARNKMTTLQVLASAGIPVPDTVLVNAQDHFTRAAAELGGYPLVVKAVSGRQGDDILLIENPRQADAFLQRPWSPRTGFILQQFIPPEARRDLRVLVVGGRVAGAVTLRPAAGDFRANFHLTGHARMTKPAPAVAETALKAATAAGLDIAGVDMLLDAQGRLVIIEINYAPGFQGLEKATGLDVAGRIIDYALWKGQVRQGAD